MKGRFLFLCGAIAPVVFVFTTILGGALRPGYSHLSNTISELFSPGAPNKLPLDILHTTFAVLLVLFAVGVLLFVRGSGRSTTAAVVGAAMLIVMALLTVTTATIFPQDAWGSPPTFPGEMHKIMSGVLSLFSMAAMVLLGTWLHRTGISPRFRIYSFITIGAVLLSAGFFMVEQGLPLMGLAERISALAGLQWTFTLALTLWSVSGRAR
jgi:hypothetical membrane protein